MKSLFVKALCYLLLLVVIVEHFLDSDSSAPLHPIYEIGIGLQFGIIAFVYCNVLTQPGHLLGRWREWINEKYLLFHVKQQAKATAENRTYDFAEQMAKHKWVLKPIIDCEWCIGGEFALWGYLFAIHSGYTLTGHLVAVCTAILVSGLATEVWNKRK